MRERRTVFMRKKGTYHSFRSYTSVTFPNRPESPRPMTYPKNIYPLTIQPTTIPKLLMLSESCPLTSFLKALMDILRRVMIRLKTTKGVYEAIVEIGYLKTEGIKFL